MNSEYIERYGTRPVIGIYSDYPDMIIDSKNQWTIKYLGGFVEDQILFGLDKWAVRVHDFKFDRAYDHLLYVNCPVILDLSILARDLNLRDTAYYATLKRFLLFRHDNHFQLTTLEYIERPAQVGVIFIDCWDSILDTAWQLHSNYSNIDLNFCQNMVEVLKDYNIVEYIFCTGDNPVSIHLNPIIDNHTNKVKLLPYDFDFANYYKKTNVNHWIIVGAHWQQCVHTREIGFNNMVHLMKKDPNLVIYSIPECTAKFVVSAPPRKIQSTLLQSDYVSDLLYWRYSSSLAELLKPQ